MVIYGDLLVGGFNLPTPLKNDGRHLVDDLG